MGFGWDPIPRHWNSRLVGSFVHSVSDPKAPLNKSRQGSGPHGQSLALAIIRSVTQETKIPKVEVDGEIGQAEVAERQHVVARWTRSSRAPKGEGEDHHKLCKQK